MKGRLRAWLGYAIARRAMRWHWLARQPRAWHWIQGQFARKATLGDSAAQSFYGHLLLFRGQGLGAREEGRRLLSLAALAGESKAAYQLGLLSLSGDARHAPDATAAAVYWEQAVAAGHPLAIRRLAELYRDGGPGLPADAEQAVRLQALATERGF